jgi:hypothetical protein
MHRKKLGPKPTLRFCYRRWLRKPRWFTEQNTGDGYVDGKPRLKPLSLLHVLKGLAGLAWFAVAGSVINFEFNMQARYFVAPATGWHWVMFGMCVLCVAACGIALTIQALMERVTGCFTKRKLTTHKISSLLDPLEGVLGLLAILAFFAGFFV